jgi:enamine deaminase RidA (YjgF/YER057c/UK114 family)
LYRKTDEGSLFQDKAELIIYGSSDHINFRKNNLNIEQRLEELGIPLPSVSSPAANYTNAVFSGNLLFISGKAPLPENGKLPRGKLGREFSTEEGYRFARSAALDLIAVMKAELGSLDRVARIVEIQGFLNTTEDFEDHPQVLNGCSDLLVEVFGEKGVHARSVFGANSLRAGVPLVLRAVIEFSAG